MQSYKLSVLWVFFILARVCAASQYHYVVCGYEDAYNTVGNSHVFARFMELGEKANAATGEGINNIDISWLPDNFSKTLSLGVWAFSYPGKSFSFEDTLAFARRAGSRVKCGEVIPTTKKHFDLAKERYELLSSGNVKYQALVPVIHNNAIGKNGKGSTNCIYSVGDLAPVFDHGTLHGWAAAVLANQHLIKNGFKDESAKKNVELEKYIHDKIRPYAPTSYLNDSEEIAAVN